MIDIRLLVSNSVHFGHQASRGNPKMYPYIWGKKNGIHIINVAKTAQQLEKAALFLKQVASEGKEILWCGTKKAASQAIATAGEKTGSPVSTHRWIGGTITNFAQVKKSVTKLLHLEDVLAKNSSHYTKKELGVFTKQVERSLRNVGGLKKLTWPIGALVVVDVKKEHVAVREAIERGIPVVAVCDTNSDPSDITYVIPANDDAPQSVACIIDYLIAAVETGKALAKEAAAQQKLAAKENAETPLPGAEQNQLQAQLAAVEAALGGDDSAGSKGRKAAPAASKAPARRPGAPGKSGDRRPRPGGARPAPKK